MDNIGNNEKQDILETKEKKAECDGIKTDELVDSGGEHILSDEELGSISTFSFTSCSETELDLETTDHVEERNDTSIWEENDDSVIDSEFDSAHFDFNSIDCESEVEFTVQEQTVDNIINFFRVKRPQRFIGQVSH